MALESRWVDAIHTRLLVRYGTRWVSMWSGIPEEAVKADWAAELDGLGPDAIAHAMQHLPHEFPPTVAQFKALALRRAEPGLKALPAPKPDPKVVAAVLDSVKNIGKAKPGREWAHALRVREERGAILSPASRQMWRAALNVEMDQPGDDAKERETTAQLKAETQRKVEEYMGVEQ